MKTIEEIAKDLCLCSEVGEKCSKCPNNEDGVNNRRCRDFRQYLAVKEAIRLAQRWISVDEELPPCSDEDILIKGVDDRGIEGIVDIGYMHKTTPRVENFISLSGEIIKVTHWRPIELK
jgi:hypothetical protein